MRAATLAAISLAVPAATAEPFLYVSDGFGSKLLKIDVGAGVVTEIGNYDVPGIYSAIAISPEGKLYTVEGWPPGTPNPRFATVDASTGQATLFGVSLFPEIFMGIGFTPDGRLYGVNAASGTPHQGSLYEFNRNTGEATKVKLAGNCGNIMDLACHPDGTLYGADPTSLFRINPNTGQATLVVKTAHTRIMGLAIDDNGVFYVSEIVPNAPLLRLDPATGATTPVPGVIMNYPHGLEFIPTPRSRPIELSFASLIGTLQHWMGSVDTDLDGSPDGELVCHQVPGSQGIRGQSSHFEADYTVETAFYSFNARLSIMLNHNNGSIRGNGAITEGWLEGTQVHLEADLVEGASAGTLSLKPASAAK